jgi:hypothetical protein
MKLPNCYVLVDHLEVPEKSNFRDVGETIEQTLERLCLDDSDNREEEENGQQIESDKEEEDESEPEEELLRKKDDDKRDRGVKKHLPDILKTKLV